MNTEPHPQTDPVTTGTPAAAPGRGEVLITVRNISKTYRLKGETVYALDDISLDIYGGEYLSIMGPSGSGKSTLFNMIGALDHPSEGDVRIGEMDLTRLTSRQLAHVRCQYIGYIFQAYNLIESVSAVRNVALPRIFAGEPITVAEAAAAACLDRVGLGDRIDHRPGELSGGQRQRVAIARALVNEPLVMLADEPTANLDFRTGESIINILKSLSVEHGVTVITATHDHKMLANSDRILWIKDGKVDRLERREDLDIEEGSVNAD